MDSVVSMEVDENGRLGGDSDHNMLITKFREKIVYVTRAAVVKQAGWDIKDDQDWTKYKEVVSSELSGKKAKGVEALSYSIAQAVLKGLEEGVGRRPPPSSSSSVQRFPLHIVRILKERRKLEQEWKKGKSEFARSGAPGHSLVVAKTRLKEKTEELERAKCKFYRQKRKPLMKLAMVNSRRARKVFWSHVSRKETVSSEIPYLQDKDTGLLRHDAEGMCDQAYKYFVDIFTGLEPRVQDESTGREGREGTGGAQRIETRGGQEEVLSGGGLEEEVGQWFSEVQVLGEEVNVEIEDAVDKWITQVGVVETAPGGGVEVVLEENPGKVLRTVDQSKRPETDPSGYLDRDFDPGEVREVLQAMGDNKASGWDSVPNEALKQGPPELVEHLVVLFNRVKEQGVVPEAWKRGRITLIHKKGPVSNIYNYRPITVLTSVSSLYTKVLNSRLITVTEEHGLLGEIQHGFRRGRSGADASFVLNTVLWKSTAKRRKVHLSFLDVAKAHCPNHVVPCHGCFLHLLGLGCLPSLGPHCLARLCSYWRFVPPDRRCQPMRGFGW